MIWKERAGHMSNRFVFVFSCFRGLAVAAFLIVLTLGLAAQAPPALKTGNPTPGTPQPEPPNLADRITLTGCVQAISEKAGGRDGAARDPNSPSDSRFVLVNAERKSVVPPATGTSDAAAKPAGRRYRLSAIDSQLSAFVGTRVEISGEVLPSATPAGDNDEQAPTLQVEFVQKLASTCTQP